VALGLGRCGRRVEDGFAESLPAGGAVAAVGHVSEDASPVDRRMPGMTHVGHGVSIGAAIHCEREGSGPRVSLRGVYPYREGRVDGDHDDPSVFRFWWRGVSERELDLIDKLTALRAQLDEVVEALMPAPVGARKQLGLECEQLWILPEGDDELLRENDEKAAAYIGELFEKQTLQSN
jgi:hypothetical protein